MVQKYKVYFANRPVIFTQEADAASSEADARMCAKFKSSGKLDVVAIETAIASGSREIQIACSDVEKSWQSFFDQFEFVQAAGGVVRRDDGKILFIFRNGKWDLPKGKVEEGESIDEGALREVEEECSIQQLELVAPLCTTWHTYIQKGDHMLKATAWYMMNYHGTKDPKPQVEEGITETRWLAIDQLDLVRANTYPSVIDVIDALLQRSLPS